MIGTLLRQAMLEYYDEELKNLEKIDNFSKEEKEAIAKYINSKIDEVKREQEVFDGIDDEEVEVI